MQRRRSRRAGGSGRVVRVVRVVDLDGWQCGSATFEGPVVRLVAGWDRRVGRRRSPLMV